VRLVTRRHRFGGPDRALGKSSSPRTQSDRVGAPALRFSVPKALQGDEAPSPFEIAEVLALDGVRPGVGFAPATKEGRAEPFAGQRPEVAGDRGKLHAADNLSPDNNDLGKVPPERVAGAELSYRVQMAVH